MIKTFQDIQILINRWFFTQLSVSLMLQRLRSLVGRLFNISGVKFCLKLKKTCLYFWAVEIDPSPLFIKWVFICTSAFLTVAIITIPKVLKTFIANFATWGPIWAADLWWDIGQLFKASLVLLLNWNVKFYGLELKNKRFDVHIGSIVFWCVWGFISVSFLSSRVFIANNLLRQFSVLNSAHAVFICFLSQVFIKTWYTLIHRSLHC